MSVLDQSLCAPDLTAVQAALCSLARPGAALAVGAVWDATARLYPEEKAAIARAVDKRRFEFATGRDLARAALAALGVGPVALPPDAQRRPRWPPGYVGSLSHAEGLCAAMAAPAGRVVALGLDMERIDAVPESLLPQIAPSDEPASLARAVPPRLVPALAFSAREAVFKAYQPATDAFLSFRDVRLAVDGDRFEARIVAPGRPPLNGRDVIEGRFAIAGAMILTVVALTA